MLQVDGNVMQFWAVDSSTVFVIGNDLNLWRETGPWGNVEFTIEFRNAVDANANDIQPLDENTVFVAGHDGNLWLETGPFWSVSQTIETRQFVDTNVLGFGVLYPSLEIYLVDGDQNLWFEVSPYWAPNRQIVDANVNSCYPVYTFPSF